MNSINRVDLAFVVDTTGSMGAFLKAAQQHMIALMEAAAKAADVRLRIAVVEYRDHPPQDRLVYRVHPFRAGLKTVQQTINGLRADGGGDGPEAVLDGVLAACRELSWASTARRIAVLVGDAPPHGVGSGGDGFPKGCPCGETIASVTAAAEDERITLYALGLTAHVNDSFGKLARLTGGTYFDARQVDESITRIESILRAEFCDLELDARVLAECSVRPEATFDDIAVRLETTPGAVAAAWTRLSARRLLDTAELAAEVLTD